MLGKEAFDLNKPVYLGDNLPETKNDDETYRFILNNIPVLTENEVKYLKSGINRIYLKKDKTQLNIATVYNIVGGENQMGGNRDEATIRFRNSNGQHVANLWIQEYKDAHNFWQTHFINIRNSSFMSTLMAYDRENGTNLSARYESSSFGKLH